MSLDQASQAFLEGYGRGARLETAAQIPGLLADLTDLSVWRRPFAFEGAGMALRARERHGGGVPWLETALDRADPVWHLFLRLGEGCALARLGEPLPSDPEVQDGYGFQAGLSAGSSSARIMFEAPRARVGLGRALWFSSGGDPVACAALVARVPDPVDWWRGIGTACVFAGDPREAARQLRARSDDHGDAVAAGAREALRLWTTLPGGVPERVHRVADVLAPATPGAG